MPAVLVVSRNLRCKIFMYIQQQQILHFIQSSVGKDYIKSFHKAPGVRASKRERELQKKNVETNSTFMKSKQYRQQSIKIHVYTHVDIY